MKLVLVSKSLNKSDSEEEIKDVILQRFGKDRDIKLFYPKKEDGKKREEYSVKQIKSITSKLSVKLDEELEPTFVLIKADRISDISQNAFLKTLEDSKYSIFLIVNNAESLLPTIRSRCQIIFLDENDLESEVKTSDSLSYGDISKFIKMEREDVKKYLQEQLAAINLNEFEKIHLYDDAIKKVEANCKIESVMYELVWKLSK